MPDISSLGLFLLGALALLLAPGPAVLYIVARSFEQGRIAGVVSALGLAIGTLVHVLAAALGISALLVSSAVAFSAVKYLGAGYLLCLGICKLLTKPAIASPAEIKKERLSRIFLQGILVNVLNPKTALFFLAFLPQFVAVSRGSITTQMVFLGMLFVILGALTDSTYALASGWVGRRWKRRPAAAVGERYFAGCVYIGLGITTALAGHKTK